MNRIQKELFSVLLILFFLTSCREPCANHAYISTNEDSSFALLGVESECPFDVMLGSASDLDVERISYPGGYARFKLTVKSDEIQIVDLDRGELVIGLFAPPTGLFERVKEPPLSAVGRGNNSTQWEIASVIGTDGAEAVLLTILVSEPIKLQNGMNRP